LQCLQVSLVGSDELFGGIFHLCFLHGLDESGASTVETVPGYLCCSAAWF
jgi:hypothetical protein